MAVCSTFLPCVSLPYSNLVREKSAHEEGMGEGGQCGYVQLWSRTIGGSSSDRPDGLVHRTLFFALSRVLSVETLTTRESML